MIITQPQQFKLFQTPLDLAHAYWKQLLSGGDHAIDATCGNGYDTLFLSQLVLDNKHTGRVIGLDAQQQAIEKTEMLLKEKLPQAQLNNIFLYNQCHSSFPVSIEKESISLIVYNLGYLPGGNKTLTTTGSTTLLSLKAALSLIKAGGAISITCYPGHDAGKPEEEMALNFAASLDPQEWSSCHHRWMNRKNGPSLILIQKSLNRVTRNS